MGLTQAIGFAESVTDGLCSLDSALNYHLFTNHYPRLPGGALDLAKRAIRLWKSGFYKATINVSSIGEHRRYGATVPISELLESWHLWPFVASENDEAIDEYEFDEAEEVDGDPIYDKAVAFAGLLFNAGIVTGQYQSDLNGLSQLLIGYCGGYADNPPGALFQFEFVNDLEVATNLWNEVNEKEG